MASPSFLRRKDKAAAPADDGGPVQQARAQARRRLIGAVVLLAIGVILFPILFETQPRPIPADIPIQVARKDGGVVTIAPAPPVPKPVPAAPPADAGVEAMTSAASAPSLPAPPPVAEVRPETAPPAPALAAASAPASQATAGRYVVQVGAFTDNVAMREARQKVEKLGLKTYTQVIETDSGKRTRVRVGPFETRDEADKATVRLKGAGLPAYILVL